MRILVTNDDGINAPGLDVCAAIARALSDDVWVVAPEFDQSGVSHSLSLNDPLRMRAVDERRFAIKGTPTDCVIMGVHHIMNGKGPADLREICIELSAWMFLLGGKSKSIADGRALAAEMIASGRARDTFREIIRLQGGDAGVVDDPHKLPQARHEARVTAPADGFITAIQCEQVGVASMMLGGGREKKEDTIDPGVGLIVEKRLGEPILIPNFLRAAR